MARPAADATAPKKADGKPSARLVTLAGLVAGGMDMETAMGKAGYGLGAIEGLAPVMPGVLEKAGLSSVKRGRPAATEQKPAAAADPGKE